jgi:hypothetical protein
MATNEVTALIMGFCPIEQFMIYIMAGITLEISEFPNAHKNTMTSNQYRPCLETHKND